MSHPRHLVLFLGASVLLSWTGRAAAGDLDIRSTGAPVVVMTGTMLAGTTPLVLHDVKGDKVELGFRESAFGATVFTQKVYVPATGIAYLSVDLPARTATTTLPPPEAAPPPPTATASVSPPAVAPPPPAVAPPPPAAPAGDIYVVTTPPGATVWLDGKDTANLTPSMLRGVGVGKHRVLVRTECARAEVDLTVTNGVIARAELTPVTGAGAIDVAAGPAGARVIVDGMDVGKPPLLVKDQVCGDHTVALRAPGYLESATTVHVPGFETVKLELTLKKEEFGTLVLDVTPLDASLKVDGIDVGTGPRTLEKIAAGPHTIAGQEDGYDPQSADVVVPPDGVTRVTLALLKPASVAAPTRASRAADNLAARPKPAPGSRNATPLRLAVNAGVTAVGAAGVVVGVLDFAASSQAYARYMASEDNVDAERIYTTEVEPERTQAFIVGGAGIAAILGATGLWVTTRF